MRAGLVFGRLRWDRSVTTGERRALFTHDIQRPLLLTLHDHHVRRHRGRGDRLRQPNRIRCVWLDMRPRLHHGKLALTSYSLRCPDRNRQHAIDAGGCIIRRVSPMSAANRAFPLVIGAIHDPRVLGPAAGDEPISLMNGRIGLDDCIAVPAISKLERTATTTPGILDNATEDRALRDVGRPMKPRRRITTAPAPDQANGRPPQSRHPHHVHGDPLTHGAVRLPQAPPLGRAPPRWRASHTTCRLTRLLRDK